MCVSIDVAKNLLIHEFKVFLQRVRADGTLAHFQVDAWEVVNIIDAHFIRYGKPTEGNVVPGSAVIPASSNQCITLTFMRIPSLVQ